MVEEAEKRSVMTAVAVETRFNTPATNANGAQHGPSSSDVPLEQIITEIWTDLLMRPQIDPHSNFFALGGQSLLAIQCVARLREKAPVILSLSDFFENPTVVQLATLVRHRLLSSPAHENAGNVQSDVDLQHIPPRDRTMPCLLSPSQERVWFIEQLNSGEPAYNEAEAVRLKGKLDADALERALNVIIERHEILRTTIEVRDGRPTTIVHKDWPTKIKKISLQHLATDQREAAMAQLLIDEPRRRYRLDAEPAIRVTVIDVADKECVVIVMMHHIICDSASLGIIWRELATLYGAFLRGQPSPLRRLPIQYGDYAAWQRQPIHQRRFEEDLSFWRETLRGAPMVLDLPADRPRPSVFSFRGNKRHFDFDSALAGKLRQLCRQEQTSLFTLFAAAINTLMYRYTGQDDILVGIPIADRERPELRSLIGFMIDTHVLRTDLSGNPTFRDLLVRVQQRVANVYSHRAAPFDQVVAALQPERNLIYSPVFQVMLNWRDRDDQPWFIGLPGLIPEPLLAQPKIAKFDLTVVLTDEGDKISLEVGYLY